MSHARNVAAAILMTRDVARTEQRGMTAEENAELADMAIDLAATVAAMREEQP